MYSEIIVNCKLDNDCFEGQQVLVEPWFDDDALTNIPYTVCRVKDLGLSLKIANLSRHETKLESGDQIGVAQGHIDVLAQQKYGAAHKHGQRYKKSEMG